MSILKIDPTAILEIDVTYEVLRVFAKELKYRGCFLFEQLDWKADKTHQQQVSYIVAVDNRHGEFICAKFKRAESALIWLKNRALSRP